MKIWVTVFLCLFWVVNNASAVSFLDWIPRSGSAELKSQFTAKCLRNLKSEFYATNLRTKIRYLSDLWEKKFGKRPKITIKPVYSNVRSDRARNYLTDATVMIFDRNAEGNQVLRLQRYQGKAGNRCAVSAKDLESLLDSLISS